MQDGQAGVGRRTAAGRARQRGVGFPRLSLATAAELLTEAARSYGPVLSREAFATLGARRRDARASTRSGSYLTKLAAFRDFGLVEVSGRQVRLTELAQRIALPRSAEARRDALETAFQQTTVFWRLYGDLPKGEPAPVETIADRAIWHYGIAASARDDFVRAFVESAAAAGLLERLDRATVRLGRDAPGPPDTAGGQTAPSEPAMASARPEISAAELGARGPKAPVAAGANAGLSPVVQQRWAGPGYAVSLEIRAERPLRAETFRQLADLIGGIERLMTEIGRG